MNRVLFLAIVLSVSIFRLNAQSIDSCVVFQPAFEEGIDAEIFSCSSYGYDTLNFGSINDICATAWTKGGDTSIIRSLLFFNINFLPSGYTVLSAKLSLYHNPTSSEGQHSSMSGPNKSLIQRIITPWQEDYVTWNTQPQTTTQNQVLVSASTSSTQNFIDIDVTQLVVDMMNNPTASYGFMIKLQDENYYRKLVFASSDHSDSALHPKLEVCLQASSTSISSINGNKSSITVFPNPADNFVSISIKDFNEDIIVSLFDITGRKLMEKSVLSSQTQFDVSRFANGVYFLEIKRGESIKSRQKFIINH